MSGKSEESSSPRGVMEITTTDKDVTEFSNISKEKFAQKAQAARKEREERYKRIIQAREEMAKSSEGVPLHHQGVSPRLQRKYYLKGPESFESMGEKDEISKLFARGVLGGVRKTKRNKKTKRNRKTKQNKKSKRSRKTKKMFTNKRKKRFSNKKKKTKRKI